MGKIQITVPHWSIRKQIRGDWGISYPKLRIWSDQICLNPQFKQKKITCQEAKQQRTYLPESAPFLSSRSLYRFILHGHFICHAVQLESNVKSVFGESRAPVRFPRAGKEESGYGGTMCCLSACPVTLRQTRLGESSPYSPTGILPGSHPCLFCTAGSIWCMAWTIRFRLWT